jgi:anti-sigma B factor antagonist
MSTLFEFQATVRANTSRALIIDLTDVPYVDSGGIGALVGAYVRHQKEGYSLALVGAVVENGLIDHAAGNLESLS